MVAVFRTNVSSVPQAKRLVSRLLELLPGAGITFDLEDCDKVLRIESARVNSRSVISVMKAEGFSCGILS